MDSNDFITSIVEQINSIIPADNFPDPDKLNHYIFYHERKLFMDFNVSEEMMYLARFILKWNMEDKGKPVEERKPIYLYIMSYGGDVDYMWMFIDTINASLTPVYTINVGVAASAASLIFMSGHKRFMTKNSKLVIHEGSATLEGDAVKVMDASKSYESQLKKMKEYILNKTSIPKTQLMKKRNNDWELDSKFCIENKITDFVIDTLDEVL